MGFFTWLGCMLALFSLNAQAAFEGMPESPSTRLRPENIAVVINILDSKSIEIGQYYLTARNIPKSNLVKVSLPVGVRNLKPQVFEELRRQILAGLSSDIQAIVLIWTTPYAVSCNSITSAITLGYDAKQCENTCAPGTLSHYFDSSSTKPFDDYQMRIAMLLPADSLAQAKSLIDKGVLSAFKLNDATAYLMETSDNNRNVRARFFPLSGKVLPKHLEIKTMHEDSIDHKQDVMFYFTGLMKVPYLQTITFLPGAIADHLTSTAGDLLGTSQMSSLRWLEAGATASYGSVSEPCNYWQKFPNPAIMLKHYLAGETAIEAYWKSVAWPSQGLFIGEPLAAPYCQACFK